MTLLSLRLIDADRHGELAECKVDCPAGATEQQMRDKVMGHLDRLGWQPVPDLGYWLRSTQNGNDQAMQRAMRGTAATIVVAVAPRPCSTCQHHEETIHQLRNALHGNKQIVERVRQILIEAGRLGHTETAPERFAVAISSVINELSSNNLVFQEIGLALGVGSASASAYPNAIRAIIQDQRDNKREVVRLTQQKDELKVALAEVQGQLTKATTELQKSREEYLRLKNETERPPHVPPVVTKPNSPSEGHL